MVFKDFMKEVRDGFKEELNGFLSERGLSSVVFLNSALQVEKKPRSLAIYPTASNGSTLDQQADANIVRFTVQFFCNSEATEKGLTQGEEYYSALLEFIQSRTFGEASDLDGSVLCRMDEGFPVNGAVFLVSSRITTNCDYGW